jgi:hypothetical protein
MRVAAINFDQGLQEAWNDVAGAVPLLAVFVLCLVAGFVIANLASVATMRLLRRVGFERAVDRSGIRRALARSRFDATELLGKVVLYGLLLLTLQPAFGLFGTNPVSDLLASVVAYLPNLFVATVIIVVAAAIASAVREIVVSALSSTTYGSALGTTSAATIVALGVFAALDQLQIAPAIVLGLFYGCLAIVVGSAIIAIGGGGIQPMRARWERALSRVEGEAPRMREGAKQAMADRRVDLVAEEEQARMKAEAHAGAFAPAAPGDTTRELDEPRTTPPPRPPTPSL